MNIKIVLPCYIVVFLLPGINKARIFSWKTRRAGEVEDRHYWNALGQRQLEDSLNVRRNIGVARNVILFLGDGMSIPTLTAARIYKGQLRNQTGEEGELAWEKFPHVGLAKTYNVDRQVPDSAGTATAYLTGVKTNYKTVGVDATGRHNDCTSVNAVNQLSSICEWALDAGKRTGFVTTTRVTHATPAASYAKSPNRDWECDSAVDEKNAQLCPDFKDIARQLVEDEPGRNFNVIMGGGLQTFDFNATSLPDDPVEFINGGCLREDGRQLWKDWMEDKSSRGKSSAFVTTKSQLEKVDASNTEYLLGLFANSHLPFEHNTKRKGLNKPTLALMTRRAIEVLQARTKGYFLMVEGGRIDHAHHDGHAHLALDETVAMDAAVQVALEMTHEEETLIVVTADHAHTMSMSGYPHRGNDILGLTGEMADDQLPYTTLMYATGPGFNYTIGYDNDDNGDDDHNRTVVRRWDLTTTDVDDWSFNQQAAVFKKSETHGGDDVAIYASGPMSHLFHGLHEQNYIAHVMSYASCVGNNRRHCRSSAFRSSEDSLLTVILPFSILTVYRIFL
ncbi:alkaline phosphatase-like [Oratosquilla oratoria]|uniref:alkaline phosphatase-like n=1 Tax=Oratosquilla oratoria TaxID=337810 RepID=UPI003F766C0E